MEENAKNFLEAFVNIEMQLKKICNFDGYQVFSFLVKEASKKSREVEHFQNDLMEFAELRNAIVHKSRNEVIAEPHLKVVEEIEKIQQILANPPKVIPTFQKKVVEFQINDSIGEAALEMAQKDYSQIPIKNEGNFYALLVECHNIVDRFMCHNIVDSELLQ